MTYVLTALGTGSIQPFIFGSNTLRENIGASEIVARATTSWVQHWLDDERIVGKGKHNFRVDSQTLAVSYDHPNGAVIETGQLLAEVIYAAGGNTLVLFAGNTSDDAMQRARQFVYLWSRQLLSEAPGLPVYAEHIEFQWDTNARLSRAVEEVLRRLGELRSRSVATQATLGLGVTAVCASTGLPANIGHPDDQRLPSFSNLANAEVGAKWATAEKAQKRLRALLPSVKEAGFEWTDDLNVIGGLPERDDSYIAIVHADGNGMGKRIITFNEICDEIKLPPRQTITAMRYMSQAMDSTAVAALQRTVKAMIEEIRYRAEELDEDQREYLYSVSPEDADLKLKERQRYFPFRPIVFGGDDMTWVCAGPWGVATAQRYLAELQQSSDQQQSSILPGMRELLERAGLTQGEIDASLALVKEDPRIFETTPVYACAGVAIVKTHYPFFQAYEIGEELAQSAKRFVFEVQGPNKDASALDWHYTTTGIFGALDEIRKSEYMVNGVFGAGERETLLIARPLMLDAQYGWRNWHNFVHVWNRFDEDWFEKRNKLLALREALRGGPTAVAQFQATQRQQLPPFSMAEATEGAYKGRKPELVNGWVIEDESARTLFFDVIEMENFLVLFSEHSGVSKGAGA